MGRRRGIGLLLCASVAWGAALGQVSHGGRPLPFVQTRGGGEAGLFAEMPPFDVAEALRIDSLEESDLRGGYRFAGKIMTQLHRGNSGVSFTTSDGTRVWRLGIRSAGALSINVMFTEYELPEGAQVFLYNPLQTQVLGSFTSLNNSEMGILPVAPVVGEELIIEYQEPAGALFAGRLTVGEVNHGYRSLRGYEPAGSPEYYDCMQSPVCFGADGLYERESRGTVLLMIDGVTCCTGVMVNNTWNDGRPYVLTASHCLNKNFSVTNPDYVAIAGSIVCFFNYSSPTCATVMRGTEEMSVASAQYRAVNTRSDMALLELWESPPAWYRPYYVGWNRTESGNKGPYINIHHPLASVKRVNMFSGEIALKTFVVPETDFYENGHWNVERWEVGSTDMGSSGSPLFDGEEKLVGVLSGGRSFCSSPLDDYFYALSKAWAPEAAPEAQLSYWLDPVGSQPLTLAGLDPYAGNPCYRLSNVLDAQLQDAIEISAFDSPDTGNMFGVNSYNTSEYAEEYRLAGAAEIEGVYVVTPAIADATRALDVEIVVYDGVAAPQNLLHAEKFYPTYTELAIDDSFIHTEKRLDRNQESFVRFNTPIKVSDAFYVGYRIKSSDSDASFAVYNLRQGETARNTAWIHTPTQQWVSASDYAPVGFNTALYIDPVVRYTNGAANETIARNASVGIALNIARSRVYVTLPETTGTAVYRLFTLTGQLLQEVTLSEKHSAIPVANVRPGVYIVNVQNADVEYSQKIVL